ncbi:MAG: amidohydrolase family protein [Proteobacteria bacterium]|nr:amidohydrolase family protein [Pseudomonadota bacterium]
MLLLILAVSTLLLRIALFEGPVKPATALPLTSIIDTHVHIAGLGYGGSGAFVSEEMEDSYKFDIYLDAFGVSRDELEKHGDQIIVQRLAETIRASTKVSGAIVLAMDGVINQDGELDKEKTQVYLPNDYVALETAKYPELYFGASINPYRKDALQRLEKVKRQGAKLIKWIPNIQHIDPSDPLLVPFYKKMVELDLPLLCHAGQERSFDSAIDEYGDPTRLELPLLLGVTVIAAHIATTGETEDVSNYERLLPMFSKHPNLYSEISSLTQLNKLGYLNMAITERELEGRLLYASDYPLVNMILVSPYYFPLNLTIEQMNEISSINNPWDRDVALKQALGVPAEMFANSAKLFNLP